MNRRAVLSDPEARREYEEVYLVGEVTDSVSALLQEMGLSQADLARRLGVTKGSVGQIRSGRQNVTLRTLAVIGWALRVSFDLAARPMADRGARLRRPIPCCRGGSTGTLPPAAAAGWPPPERPDRPPA